LPQEIIEAPITGTVISIEVKVGDKVEEGDVLLYMVTYSSTSSQ